MSDEAHKSPEELIEEGGKPLEDALLSELKSAEGDTAAEPPHVEGKPNGDDSEPAIVDQKADEPDEPDVEPKKDDSGAEPEPKGQATERKESKSVKKLLHQRNSAQAELEATRQKLAEAERKLAERGEPDDAEDSPDEDEPDLDKRIDARLEERESKRESESKKSELDKKERDELVEKYRPTKEELAEMDTIIRANPNLSDEAALRVVNPAYFVGARPAGDGKRQSADAPTRSDLRKDFDPSKLSTNEMEDYLREEMKSGHLKV